MLAVCSPLVAGGGQGITEAPLIQLQLIAVTTAPLHIRASTGRLARRLTVVVEMRDLPIQPAMARTTVAAAASLPVAIPAALAVLQVRVWGRHRPEH